MWLFLLAFFIPCLLAGSAYGRLVGELLNIILPSAHISPGTYALLGSAAMLSGVMRMTMSAVVILIEATGGVQFGLPIMITILVSKVTGDFFNQGIYDLHSQAKGYPYLEQEPALVSHFLAVADVCSTPVIIVRQVECVGSLAKMLRSNQHNGFPVIPGVSDYHSSYVVKAQDHVAFSGIISRHIMCIVLTHPELFHDSPPQPGSTPVTLTYDDIQNRYPRFPAIETVLLTPQQRQMFVDLTPFVDPSPLTIQLNAYGNRAFRLFRTLGLRHLPVVDSNNCVVGMITRKDLLTTTLVQKAEEVLQSEESQRRDTHVEVSISQRRFDSPSPRSYE